MVSKDLRPKWFVKAHENRKRSCGAIHEIRHCGCSHLQNCQDSLGPCDLLWQENRVCIFCNVGPCPQKSAQTRATLGVKWMSATRGVLYPGLTGLREFQKLFSKRVRVAIFEEALFDVLASFGFLPPQFERSSIAKLRLSGRARARHMPCTVNRTWLCSLSAACDMRRHEGQAISMPISAHFLT